MAQTALSRILGPNGQPMPRSVSPFREAGVSGTAVWGGYIENSEKDSRLRGLNRYKTATDIMVNVAIVGAGLRFFLNLAGSPKWTIEPAKARDAKEATDEAKKAAEFFEDVLNDMQTSWKRIVRRSGMYRFHGYGIQEWTAKRRPDGKIGLLDIEPRPQHTIEKWEIDAGGTVLGVWQRAPMTGQLLPIPRSKMMYLVDDMLTDSPEGLGLLRQVMDPADRLRRYLALERIGFDRDMRGVPLGKAPLAEIQQALDDGSITAAQADKMLRPIRDFVRAQTKGEETGFLMDSSPYFGQTGDGVSVSSATKWGLELLSSAGSGFADIARSIDRETTYMAWLLGVETLLMGNSGNSGSRSLGEDKSRNLYLAVNACVDDMAVAVERDIRDPVWALNGLSDELKPKVKVEDVAFKDVQAVAQTLRDMATAGATLTPDDPVIDDVRDLLGVSRQPELSDEEKAMMRGFLPGTQPGAPKQGFNGATRQPSAPPGQEPGGKKPNGAMVQ